METHFKINNVSLPYHRGTYNKSYENERSCEVPLGHWFLDKFNDDVLEVGCVLPYYLDGIKHTVIDLTDIHPCNIKANALDWDYTGKNVLCVSTIEHLQKREYSNGSDQDAVTLLNLIISQAANWLITFPPTYHPILDAYLKSNTQITRRILKRANWFNEWEVEPDSNNFDFLFGHRDGRSPDGVFNNANAICLITNQKELL